MRAVPWRRLASWSALVIESILALFAAVVMPSNSQAAPVSYWLFLILGSAAVVGYGVSFVALVMVHGADVRSEQPLKPGEEEQ